MKNGTNDQRIENGRRTVSKLLLVAKQMFGTNGYAETSTSDIVKKAGIARGGLYHHFSSKKEIFRAVCRLTILEIADETKFDKTATDGKKHLLDVTRSFLNACLDPQRLQIVMIDAPSVLGMDEFRKLDKEFLTGQLFDYLTYLLESGRIRPINTEIMAHLLAGAANEGVFLIAQSENKDETLKHVYESMELFLDSFWA